LYRYAAFLISNVVTNNAAAALIFPIAAEAAERQGETLQSIYFLVMAGLCKLDPVYIAERRLLSTTLEPEMCDPGFKVCLLKIDVKHVCDTGIRVLAPYKIK
jgi:hypothetical protein